MTSYARVCFLFRFYEPDEGGIALGGRDLSTYDAAEISHTVSWVTQEPQLFPISGKFQSVFSFVFVFPFLVRFVCVCVCVDYIAGRTPLRCLPWKFYGAPGLVQYSLHEACII